MAKKTITLLGDPIFKEALGSGAITPGHLLELMSAGTVKSHSNAGQNASRMFAREDELQGKEIIDDYATGKRVLWAVYGSGMEVYALIANGQNIAIGDYLESAGDGTLRAHSADSAGAVEYPECIVAQAMEACDMSDSSAADPSGRCRVQIV